MQKIGSFKNLAKTSLEFYKLNWKKITLFFLPIQVIVFVATIVLGAISESNSGIFIGLGVIFGAISFLASLFLGFIMVGAPIVIQDIEQNVNTPNTFWYKVILSKILSLAWIGILVSFLNIGFLVVIILVAFTLFMIPTFLTAMFINLGWTNFASSFQALFINDMVVGISFFAISIAVFVSVIALIVNTYFATYSFIMNGRRGLDAITESFLLVYKRRTKIFWRIVLIWIIISLPFLLLVFPIQAKIIYDGLRAMVIEVFLLHIPPAWPEISLNLFLAKETLSFLASILSLPIFAILNYFLWKDVRSSAIQFEENKYNKTRKWVKRGVYFGVVILSLIVISSFIFV